jgi:hypothetical protein
VLKAWQSQLSNINTSIHNNKVMLFWLDTMEEFRDLSMEEWNFKNLVRVNIENLLEQQRIYWQQRGRVKWAALGDENTKFFHSTATIRHNKNTIMVLKYSSGLEKVKHEGTTLIL